MKLSQDIKGLLPTEEEIRFYEAHGWYISRKLFSDEAITEALTGMARFYAGHRNFEVPPGMLQFLNWTPDAGERLRLNDFISFQNAELRSLTLDTLLGAVAATLARTNEVRLFNATLIYKPSDQPGCQTEIGWHTDRAYWKTCTSTNMLTAWIPFHDCDEEMGTITMLDGSHRWDDSPELNALRREKSFFRDDFSEWERKLERIGMPLVKVPMNLKKGQVSFHHCLTFHGSGANRSPVPRRSVAVHLQDVSNRYRSAVEANGTKCVYKADAVCRRTAADEPDYSDPVIFPTLWRKHDEDNLISLAANTAGEATTF